MCGITGIIYKDKNRIVDREILQRANDTLTHRGPDDSGYYIDGNVGIAMRRLSIIDVSGGHQPISNEDNTVHIIYNGELYNYTDLRNQLIQKGHYFKTKSDTESILHAYEEYGVELFPHLNGMFAFAIRDEKSQTLLLARDRLGIKPLFYYEDEEKFIFASEIKAILAFGDIETTLDYQSLFDYFTFNYIPAPKTIYQKIKKLEPAHYLLVKDNKVEIHRYWNYEYHEDKNITIEQASKKLEELLYDSINIRLMSEVPLGAFLSGGIDSSTISYFITRHHLKEELHTFSIGFETKSKYNELPFSTIVAQKLNTQHHTQIVNPSMIELLPQVVCLFDEPMSDPSAIPTYLLSQFTRQFVTVALSGDGGDELLAGYERQKVLNILNRFYCLPYSVQNFLLNIVFTKFKSTEQKDSLISSVLRVIDDIKCGYNTTYKRWVTNFNEQLLQTILSNDLYQEYVKYQTFRIVDTCFSESTDPINQSLCFETKYYLPDDLLAKVDRTSMGHSLEVRVPFIDHRLVEFAASIPVNFKIRNGTTKFLLRHLMRKYLPHKIIHKPKQGFSPPIKEWLKSDLKDYTYDMLNISGLIHYFNPVGIQYILNNHYSGKRDFQYQIWSLLVFQIWLKNCA